MDDIISEAAVVALAKDAIARLEEAMTLPGITVGEVQLRAKYFEAAALALRLYVALKEAKR
jgi:hypothetical protein